MAYKLEKCSFVKSPCTKTQCTLELPDLTQNWLQSFGHFLTLFSSLKPSNTKMCRPTQTGKRKGPSLPSLHHLIEKKQQTGFWPYLLPCKHVQLLPSFNSLLLTSPFVNPWSCWLVCLLVLQLYGHAVGLTEMAHKAGCSLAASSCYQRAGLLLTHHRWNRCISGYLLDSFTAVRLFTILST